jgi:predicted glycosyltransferase
MRILIDVTHPKHVHLFKHAIWQWQARGDEVLVVGREKDVTTALLTAYGLGYVKGTTLRPGMIQLASELLHRLALLVKVSRKFRSDLFLSEGSAAAALASRLVRVPHIAIDDTEHSVMEHALYVPFSDVICTPSCYTKDLGHKQRRFDGYEELAYLHPNWFKPDPSVLSELGLQVGDRFFVVRFVSWEAVHDVGQQGFSRAGKLHLVASLQELGRVIITSESPLPPELEPFRMSVSPIRIHDLLAFSTLYIGEGGTMATEAAVLGVPSIFVSTLRAGNFEDLQGVYGLMLATADETMAIEQALKWGGDPDIKQEWKAKRARLLQDKIDTTSWLIDFVDRYVEHRRGHTTGD